MSPPRKQRAEKKVSYVNPDQVKEEDQGPPPEERQRDVETALGLPPGSLDRKKRELRDRLRRAYQAHDLYGKDGESE